MTGGSFFPEHPDRATKKTDNKNKLLAVPVKQNNRLVWRVISSPVLLGRVIPECLYRGSTAFLDSRLMHAGMTKINAKDE
jgi:hypothetical protein